ncbi:hypothetical protein EXIGLDRAFT_831738 [Exidia glandulosa HHB12029]|uniref:HAT C-terminal dimerisation domain-containing protein n=1 Tax=Exidia glandulosa HHB12029 TaxID=1314781 RepID=A0A165MFD3_EXIGL|nr:hypothetical protein EXIGLDRAFT_831738 [Exidia glandulosa HHB12029]
MGKEKSWAWEHFIKGPLYKTNNTYHEARCRFCINVERATRRESDVAAWQADSAHVRLSDAQIVKAADDAIEAICGKPHLLLRHLRNCDHVPDAIKLRAEPKSKDSSTAAVGSSSASASGSTAAASTNGQPASAPPAKMARQSAFTVTTKARFTPAVQKDFESDVCRLFIANDWSWNGVENPTTEMFFEKWVPGSQLPPRQRLSGSILESEAAKVRENIKTNVSGRFATGQCDGWKNVAKSALIATMITVNFVTYCLHLHDLTAVAKTAECLLGLVLGDIAHASSVYLTTIVAWCSDAGGDSRGMRRLLHAKMPHIICLDCWAHQINLVVGDYLKAQFYWVTVLDEAQDVIKWFNNHSRALSLLRRRQKEAHDAAVSQGQKTRGVLALFLPIVTRWIAHYASAARLLDVGRILRAMAVNEEDEAALIAAAGGKPDAEDKAREIIAIIERKSFWTDLAKVKFELEPLAIAQNVTQGANTRLDHVLVTLGNLFAIYSRDAYSEPVRTAIKASLEKRWAKADQDAFIAAVFLNPLIRDALFNSTNISAPQLYGILKRLYKRVFRTDPSTDMYTAFNDYRMNRGQLSDEAMLVEELRDSAAKEGKGFPILEFWSGAEGKIENGTTQLARLAALVLSIVANSAETERLWSRMGIIHTKLRNRLGAQKVHDTAMIKMDIQREHIARGRLRPRAKRKIGSDNEPAAVAQPSEPVQRASPSLVDAEEAETESALDLATRLQRELDDDDEDEDMDIPAEDTSSSSTTDAPTTPAARRVIVYFGTQRPLKLAELFDYTKTTTTPTAVGLDVFWKAASANLQQELTFYDLLAATNAPHGGNEPGSRAAGSETAPIVLE